MAIRPRRATPLPCPNPPPTPKIAAKIPSAGLGRLVVPGQLGLENLHFLPYISSMDAKTDNTPPGWLEELEEDLEQSDAEYEAGIFVTSEEVHGLLRNSIAELEAKAPIRKRDVTKLR